MKRQLKLHCKELNFEFLCTTKGKVYYTTCKTISRQGNFCDIYMAISGKTSATGGVRAVLEVRRVELVLAREHTLNGV